MLIILDTNFLLYAASYKIDVSRELARVCDFNYRVIIPEQVSQELKILAKSGRGKEKRDALIALELAKEFKMQKTSAKNADDAILKLASDTSDTSETEEVCIGSLDKALLTRFKKFKKGKILTIRQKKYICFVN